MRRTFITMGNLLLFLPQKKEHRSLTDKSVILRHSLFFFCKNSHLIIFILHSQKIFSKKFKKFSKIHRWNCRFPSPTEI